VLAGTSVLRNTCGRGGDGYTAQGGGNGGGLHCKRATIERCTIEGNTTGAGGDSADTGWSAAGHGGHGAGVYCSDSLEVFDSLIAGNRTGQGGSALSTFLDGDDGSGAGLWCALAVIDHCTIVSNAVADQRASAGTFGTGPGAGVLCSNQTVVTNTIVWDNVPDQLAGHNCNNVLYCDIEGSTCLFNTGNIASDPLFVQPGNWVDAADPSIIVTSGEPGAVWASGDYQLADGSPCADAADPEALRDPDRTDLQGIPRFSGAAADIGAYEIQGLVPLYRFVAPATGRYFYTPSEDEKDKLITQQSHLWTYEGIAYHVYLRAADPGLMPVYRFWSDALASHLWTIDESEYDRLTTQQSYLWTYEGIAFYAYPPGKQPAGAKPVYRFGSSRLNAQFFTADDDERRLFVSTMSQTWVYEEIAWYTFDSDGGSDTPGTSDTAGIYEFSGGRDGASFTLEIKAYLDGQQAQLDTTNVVFTPASGRMQMAVDLAGLTTELNGFHVESELLQHDGIATEATGKFTLPFSMVLYGFFDSAVARGPYAVDARALSFPAAGQQGSIAAGETFSIIGSAVVENTKFEVSLDLSPTEFALDGLATFDNSDDTGRLDVTMNGPFQWTRSRQEDLLLEADIRGHVLQLYVTNAEIRSTGLWLGKRVPEAKDEGK
jgi:hypothetical protein